MFGDVQFSTFKTIVDVNTVRREVNSMHHWPPLHSSTAWLP
jgi:hypothetical protein